MIGKEIRRRILPRFPYSILYKIDDKTLKQLDMLVKSKFFSNRSNAIQQAVNERSGTVIAVAITSQRQKDIKSIRRRVDVHY